MVTFQYIGLEDKSINYKENLVELKKGNWYDLDEDYSTVKELISQGELFTFHVKEEEVLELQPEPIIPIETPIEDTVKLGKTK